MKAMVLGAGGQIGRALLALVPDGTTPFAYDRAALDISDPRGIRRAIDEVRPDIILNAAAYTNVDGAETNINDAQCINADAPGHLAAAARQAGARLLHISTDFVFDGFVPTPRRPDDPTNPLNVYGRTKRAGEQAVLAAAPDSLIVRSAWIYAAQGKNFLNVMLGLMRERGRVTVVADQIGTPTWAMSLAAALWALVRTDSKGIHHYTDAGIASWYDFAVAIEEEARAIDLLAGPVDIVPISTADYPTPAVRPPYGVLDKQQTWRLLGGPAPHWRVSLRACLEELKASG
jgi:dTDP-4-dehydrorhamnose reductase